MKVWLIRRNDPKINQTAGMVVWAPTESEARYCASLEATFPGSRDHERPENDLNNRKVRHWHICHSPFMCPTQSTCIQIPSAGIPGECPAVLLEDYRGH